ncbi:hypothetical protein ACFWCM_17115, partial [Streptomyces albidoflavus]
GGTAARRHGGTAARRHGGTAARRHGGTAARRRTEGGISVRHPQEAGARPGGPGPAAAAGSAA